MTSCGVKKTTTIKTGNPNENSDSAKSLVKQEEKQQSKDLPIPASDKKTKPVAEIKTQPQFEPITSIPQASKKIVKTDAEWKALLSPEEYQILRRKGTERAFTGKFDKHYKEGTYTCLLYTSPSPRDGLLARMPSSA